MAEIKVRRKFFDKAVVRKLDVPRLGREFIEGAVWGLQHAFDVNDYEFDLSDVERAQAQMDSVRRTRDTGVG